MGDAISIRMYGDPVGWEYGKANLILNEFARWADIPIINMECDKYHPCQGLADILTMKEKLGSFKGKKFVMSWAYSPSWEKPLSVPQSAVIAASMMGMDVVQAQPKGFDLDPEVIKACKRNARETGGSFEVMYDMEKAFEGADVVYPKSWTVLENLPPFSKKLNLAATNRMFAKNKHWICDKDMLKKAKKGAYYMHCLPCDRGFEVTNEVVDGPQSIVFDQAENRLHVQKAVMALTMR